MSDLAAFPPKPPAGLLESTLRKLFMRPTQVLSVEDIGSAFRLLALGGEALRGVDWTAGDKIQIQMGRWTQRTYTPMSWDAEHGTTRILLNLHTDGPGGQWARSVRAGDDCIVFGPRSSLDLQKVRAPAILFGDETSFGLAAALSGQVPGVPLLFEVASAPEARAALDRLALHGAQLHVRLPGDAHWPGLAEALSVWLQSHPAADLVLTGKARSIQHMQRTIRTQSIACGRCLAKAYWAPGKTGLD